MWHELHAMPPPTYAAISAGVWSSSLRARVRIAPSAPGGYVAAASTALCEGGRVCVGCPHAASSATFFSGRVFDVNGNRITSIPGHGYGVFQSGQGLGSGGDAVKIYLPDGTLIDSVTFTAAQAGYDESVDPEAQGRGVGGALTEFATGRLRERGMRVAMVETGGDPGHAAARHVYERAGYQLLPVARYFKNL